MKDFQCAGVGLNFRGKVGTNLVTTSTTLVLTIEECDSNSHLQPRHLFTLCQKIKSDEYTKYLVLLVQVEY